MKQFPSRIVVVRGAWRWIALAFATLGFLAPATAFLAGTPRVSLPTASSHTSHLSQQNMLPSSRGCDVPTSSTRHRRAAGSLSMSTETAVEQKGLVTVYHKETCPYCKEALELLEEGYSLQVTRVDLLEGEDSDEKIKQMKTFSGRNTVPQIFFNADHVGGNDDLQKLHEDGELEALVAKVRAEPPGMMKSTWYHPWY
ncbi:unnamed protein product [Ascophyllum nodosum]